MNILENLALSQSPKRRFQLPSATAEQLAYAATAYSTTPEQLLQTVIFNTYLKAQERSSDWVVDLTPDA